MIILPAIDIHNGQAVRLVKGDYSTAQKVAADPLETALGFARQGARWLHMVDLDGSKDGTTPNFSLFAEAARLFPGKMELGGGIRSLDTVEQYLSAGVERVILGSAAVQNPSLVRDAVRAFGERIAVGIDARDGYVATGGWLETSEVYFTVLAREMEQAGVRTFIFTDIARDGTLSGPNLDRLRELQAATGAQIVASGGIRSFSDVRDCAKLGLYGAICGKSLYAGTLSLREALTLETEEWV